MDPSRRADSSFGACAYMAIRDREKRFKPWLRLGLGITIPLIAYLAFQRGLSGELLPNTFFAKQAEYAVLRELPLVVRMLTQIGIPGEWLGNPACKPVGRLSGLLIVLVPGLLIPFGGPSARENGLSSFR